LTLLCTSSRSAALLCCLEGYMNSYSHLFGWPAALRRRFAPESEHGANAGLAIARKLLEPVKAAYPWISYADLWTLAGAVAIEAMGGEGRGCSTWRCSH
jgi:catalase (peroxidase I)